MKASSPHSDYPGSRRDEAPVSSEALPAHTLEEAKAKSLHEIGKKRMELGAHAALADDSSPAGKEHAAAAEKARGELGAIKKHHAAVFGDEK